MNTLKMVAIFAENKPGQSARITGILANSQINIRNVTLASTGAFGVMKLLVNDPVLACQALKHEGFPVTLLDVLAVELPDKVGALHTVADCLAKNNINLENMSGFVVNSRAILVLEVPNAAQAAKVLQKQGLHVLTQKEIMEL
jgi:hypothetical protein